MKVVLRTDVNRVGKKGDVIDVADGFGRNYLIPKGLALLASSGAQAQAAAMRRARDLKDARDRQEAEAIATQLVPAVIRVSGRAGTEGRLFGSITTADITDAIRTQVGIDLDRRRLHLDEAIKTLGRHEVAVRLHPDVQFVVAVEVEAET